MIFPIITNLVKFIAYSDDALANCRRDKTSWKLESHKYQRYYFRRIESARPKKI